MEMGERGRQRAGAATTFSCSDGRYCRPWPARDLEGHLDGGAAGSPALEEGVVEEGLEDRDRELPPPVRRVEQPDEDPCGGGGQVALPLVGYEERLDGLPKQQTELGAIQEALGRGALVCPLPSEDPGGHGLRCGGHPEHLL